MRTITGLLAILLGVVGVLVCVAGGGAAWWAAFKFAGRVDELVGRADKSLGTADEALGRVGGKVASTTAALENVRASASRLADGNAAPAAQARVTRLLDELTPHLDRAEALADSLQALGEVLRHVADTAGQLDLDQAAQIRSAADNLGGAAETLGLVRDRAADIRQGGAAPRAQELVRLAEQAKAPLDRLGSGLADVRAAVGDVREELPEVRRGVSTWKYAGPAVVTVILLWVGLGQLCLIGWGRRRLSRPDTPPPPPTPPARA